MHIANPRTSVGHVGGMACCQFRDKQTHLRYLPDRAARQAARAALKAEFNSLAFFEAEHIKEDISESEPEEV